MGGKLESLRFSWIEKRRRKKRRSGARRKLIAEICETRILLAADTAPTANWIQAEDPGLQVHAALAPDTPQSYADQYLQFQEENLPQPIQLTSRWSTTATNGSGLTQGDATTLTWSIVPDGTAIPALFAGGESSDPSDLVSYLSGIYGTVTNDLNYTDEIWFSHFQSVFDRWEELSGLTYVYEPNDDGAGFTSFSGSAPGVLGVRGDVRIGGHLIDGNSGTLAYNFFPNHGEMVIDTGDNFFTNVGGNSLGLRNTVAHEVGHGIGLRHTESSNSAILMEPFISLGFDGPQFDDILGAHRHYGDFYEDNDNPANAVPLGTLAIGTSTAIGLDGTDAFVSPTDTDFVSIDNNIEQDFFSFTITEASSAAVTLTPVGPTYQQGPQNGTQTTFVASEQNNLSLQLIAPDGSTVLGFSDVGGLGEPEFLNATLAIPGTYFVRVTGSDNAAQMYSLDVATSAPGTLFPFQRLDPFGGLISGSNFFASIPDAVTSEEFEVYFETDETLTGIATAANPSSSVTIEVVGLSGPVTSPAAGEPATLPLITFPSDGLYTIRISADSATNVEFAALRNAIGDDLISDTDDGAELDADGSLIPFGSGRFGIYGRSDAVATLDLEWIQYNDPGAFVDISGTGAELATGDESHYFVETFIGNSIFPAGDVAISDNGGIVIPHKFVTFNNQPLPFVDPDPDAAFETALLPFWDDWENGNIYLEETLIDGTPTLIVQWEDRTHFEVGGTGTFQVQVFESGPVFARFAYQDVLLDGSAADNGGTATIGYQASFSDAIEFSFNDPSVFDGDVLDLQFANNADVDEYTIGLSAGQQIDVVLAGQFGADFSGQLLELLDTDGTSVLATATAGASNFDLGIEGFAVPGTGVYTIRLTSSLADEEYGIVVSEPFNTEGAGPTSGDISATGKALGFLDAGSDPTDTWTLDLSAGELVTLETQTLFDNADATPLNDLDVALEVFAPGGASVAFSDSGSAGDGRNESLSLIAPLSGTYEIRVTATSGLGEYLLETSSASVYLNEIHYDNAGADVNEFVEVAGAAGTDLAGWSISLYNGADGTEYASIPLIGTIDDEGAGYGALSFGHSGIQNGAPDGFALVDNLGSIVEFLSYEGTFTATDGPANGRTSVELSFGVAESGTTLSTESLQRNNSDPTVPGIWDGPFAASPGDLNVAPSPVFEIIAIDADQDEGDADTTAFQFQVNRIGDHSGTDSVDFDVAGAATGDPADAGDFGGAFPSGTVTFLPGERLLVLDVLVSGDTVDEPDETFTVSLSNPSAGTSLSGGPANGTIRNDDAFVPDYSIAPASLIQAEGDSGTTQYVYTVTRTGDVGNAETIDWVVTGSGIDPADTVDFFGGFFPIGTATFSVGSATADIIVDVNGDTDAENNESFTVTLSNPSLPGTLSVSTADGTILDDDSPVPNVWINELHYDNAGGDTGEFVEVAGVAGTDLSAFTLLLYNGDNGQVYDSQALSGVIDDEAEGYGAVGFSISGIQNGPDAVALVYNSIEVVELLSYGGSFTAVGGAADGLVSTDIGVTENGSTPIGSSLYRVNSILPAPNTWSGPEAQTFDDLNFASEPRLLTIDVVELEVSESAGAAASDVIVTRNFDVGSDLIVDLVSDDTTEATVPLTVTIPAGQLSATVSLDAIDDAVVDGDQTVTITASIGGGAPITEVVPDPSFAGDGQVVTNLIGDISPWFADLAIQPDGKIIALGQHDSFNEAYWDVQRLNPDGTPDIGFGTNGTMRVEFPGESSSLPEGIMILSGGELAVVGRLQGDSIITKFTSTGALDPTFDGDGILRLDRGVSVNTHFYASLVNPDGTMILAGTDTSTGPALAKINADGTLDASFGTNGYAQHVFDPTVEERVYDVQRQADGKLIIVGYVLTGGLEGDPFIARLNADGSVDNTFGVNGIRVLDLANDLALFNSATIQPDGNIVATGRVRNHSGFSAVLTARFTPSGTLDTTFSGDGLDTVSVGDGGIGNDVVLQPDGKIVVVGSSFDSPNPGSPFFVRGMIRYNVDGTLDTSLSDDGVQLFGAAGTAFSEGFMAAVMQPDGRIVTYTTPTPTTVVERWILPDGSTSTPSLSETDTVVVNDDDVALSLAPTSAVKDEGNGGVTPFTFTVTRSGDLSSTTTVDYVVTGSGASPADAADFSGGFASGTVMFAAGESTQLVSIDVNGDTTVEPDEGFTVTLINPSSPAVITTATADGEIVNDDVTLDFGDAPTAAQSGFAASYPVLLADDGARHVGIGPRLGTARDFETDGLPTSLADGDDGDNVDDEDGVALPAVINVSSDSATTASVDIDLQNADAVSNRLDAWIDFNRDGDWDDAGEQIFTNFDLGTANGLQSLPFNIPQDTGSNVDLGPGTVTYAWTGFLEDDGANPWGLSGDGSLATPTDGTPFSVEIVVDQNAADGYAGNTANLATFLTTSVSFVIDGTPTTTSNTRVSFTDDVFGNDRISFSGNVTYLGIPLQISAGAVIPGSSYDLFDDTSADPPPIFATSNPLQFGGLGVSGHDTFTIPADAPVTSTAGDSTSADTYARFRLSTAGGLSPSGLADDGEVEDHLVSLNLLESLAPEINVTGNGFDIADEDVTPSAADGTDFGSVLTNSGSATNSFTITNDGDGELNLGVLAVSGPAANDFIVTNYTPGILPAGGSLTFDVTFDPIADGVRDATVLINNDDADENPYNFAITGNGLPPSVLNELVFNEVLPDPSGSGFSFDTDGDGTVEDQDEFVEFFNTSSNSLDISGLEFWDPGVGNYFTVPGGTTLGPGGFLAVVGDVAGGSLPSVPAGSHIFSADGAMGLNNGGDNLIVFDPTTDQYIQAIYNDVIVENPAAGGGYGSKWGDPNHGTPSDTITWSLMEDGTGLAGTHPLGAEVTGSSDITSLQSSFDAANGAGAFLAAISDAFDTWAAATGGRVTFQQVPDPGSSALGGDNSNPNSYAVDIRIGAFHSVGGSAFAGLGAVGYGPPGNDISFPDALAGDIVINLDQSFYIAPGSEDDVFYTGGAYVNDFPGLMLHEIGHAGMGLFHPAEGVGDVMFVDVFPDCCDFINREPSPRDVNRAQEVYGEAISGFSTSAGLLGNVFDFGNDTDGTSRALSPDGDTTNVVDHNSIGAGLDLATPGNSNVSLPQIVDVAVDPASVLEGTEDPMTFTLTRSGNVVGTLTVGIDLSGSATLGTDYNATPTTSVFFGEGVTEVTVTVTPIDDQTAEPDETIVLSILSGSGYTPGIAIEQAVILDDDNATLTVDIVESQVSELDGNGASDVVITRNFAVDQDLIVDLASDDTTEATIQASATIPAGQVSVTVPLNAINDGQVDGNQLVTITASTPSLNATDTVLVVDANAQFAIAPQDADKPEGDAGNTPFFFTVTRSGDTSGASSVQYMVSGIGTDPADPADFGGSFPFGSLSFADGESSQTLTIFVSGDPNIESDESFQVTLFNASFPANIISANADGIIRNDDAGTLTVSVIADSVIETDGPNATTVVIGRNGNLDDPLLVSLSSDDTSEAIVPPTVVIPAGQASVSVPIEAIDDVLFDGDQTVTIAASTQPAFALDPTFDDDGIYSIGTLDGGGQVPVNARQAVQQDGKIVTAYNKTNNLIYVRRHLDDGTLDTAFGTNGLVIDQLLAYESPGVRDVIVQADGKIVVAGTQGNSSSGFKPFALRFNSDGTPDTTFGVDGLALINASGVQTTGVFQQGDKLVLVGDRLWRLNADGSIDATFGSGGSTSFSGFWANGHTVQADGKILVTGWSSGTSSLLLQRFNADGSRDFSFGTNSVASLSTPGGSARGYDVDVQPDGNIVVVGLGVPSGGSNDTLVARFLPDGSLDPSFGVGGVLISGIADQSDFASQIEITPSGLLLVGSNTVGNDVFLRVYGPDGALLAEDDTTVTSSWDSQFALHDLNLQADGKPLVAFYGPGLTFFRFAPFAFANFNDGSDTLIVEDNEVGALVIDFGQPEGQLPTVSENRTIDFTVTRTGTTSGDLTVSLTSSDETELLVPASVIIPDGQTSVVVTASGVQDGFSDGTQSSVVRANAPLHEEDFQVVRVTDDAEPALSLSLSQDTISENGGSTILTITRFGLREDPLTISLTGDDPSELLVPSPIDFAANEATVTVTLDAVDDFVFDGTQIVNVTAQWAEQGVVESVVVNVLDDEPIPLTITNDDDPKTSFLEDSEQVNLTVTRAGATDAELIVNVSTDLASDLTVPSTLTFPAGVASVPLVATPIADIFNEPDEPFNILVGTIGQTTLPTFDGVILDDDTNVVSVVNVTDALEDGTGEITFQFRRTAVGPETPALTVPFSFGGTATLGVDYPGTTPQQITFPAGSGLATLSIDPTDDALVEANESIILTMDELPDYEVSPLNPSATGFILNDDSASLSIGDVTLVEGDSGETNATFDVTLDNAVDVALSVAFATSDDTATTADADYDPASGNITFSGSAGETQTIQVAVNGDTKVELDETFFVNLLSVNASGRSVTISDAQGVGTIENDDSATLSIDDVSVTEGDSGTSIATFTVSLDHPVGEEFTVDFLSADDSATIDDADYVASSGTLTFTGIAAETQTVEITINGDTKVESDELFFVNLSNLQAAGLAVSIGDDQGVGTITNDDSATLSINDVTVTEGDAGTSIATFTVTLDADVSSAFTVDVATADETATTGDNDYVAGSGTLNFAGTSGETQTFDVTINGDTVVELDETYFVNLSNLQASGLAVSIGDGQGVGTITNDDSATLSINDVTITEGDSGTTTATFTVTLDADVSSAFTVDVATADDTATTGDSDYVAGSGTLNFAGTSGETQTFDVTINGDTLVELDETYFVNLSNLQAAGLAVSIGDGQGVGTITNDDSATLSINDVTVTEGDAGTSIATFTVTLDADVNSAFTVDVATADDTATTGDSDYVAGNGTLNFAGTAGETQTFDVTINGDTVVELDETFFVNLSNVQAAGLAVSIGDDQGVGTITNDDSATLSINDVTVTEGDAGTSIATFTVTLDADVSSAFTVDIATADDTATTGDSDYVAGSGTLNFAGTSGETQTFDVTINGDTIVELDETFFVNLSNLQAAGLAVSIGDGQGVGTITNDDSATLSINDVTVTEGNAGTSIATFTVTLDADVSSAFTVDVATANDTATTGDNDYVAGSGTLNFAGTSGETQTFDVTINGDTVVELDETYLVNLSNLQAAGLAVSIGDGQGVGTITNDDSATLSINDVTVTEGDSGTSIATFTVTLDADVSSAFTVDLATADDTATAGDNDYVAGNGTLNFSGTSGETQTFDVTINGDTVVELDETYFVNLSNLQSAGLAVSIGDGQGVGTITNDDSATLSINDVTVTEGDAGTSIATFTVTLNADVSSAFTVDVATADDTATTGDNDYVAGSGTLNFAGTSGETQTFDVTINGDTVVELDETYFVNLSNLQAAGLAVSIGDGEGVGTITNDDSATLSINDVTVTERDSGTSIATFTVTLDADVSSAFTVDVATADDTATTGDSDYVAGNGTLNFAGTSGETQTFDVTINGDTVVELDETYFVNLSNLQAAGLAVSIGDGQGVGTITNDDSATLSINDVTITEGDSGTTTATFTVTLDADVSSAFTVDVATADDTATTGDSDYFAGSGTLNFAGTSGETQTIDVTINGDTLVELDETYFVNLSNLQAAGLAVSIGDGQGVGTITNDDSATLSINDLTVTEGDAGTSIATFTVTLDADVSSAFTVDVATADDTATTGDSDYVAGNGTLNFAGTAGETQTFDVTINGDTVVELDETFLVNLSNLQAAGLAVSIGDGQGVGTITNDDSATLSINDVTVTERDSGTSIATFTVTLDADVSSAFTVDIATADDTSSTGDNDYVAGSGTLNFAGTSGETQTFDVTINGDNVVELDETFFVNLSNLQAATLDVTISDGQGIGTIENDDSATLSINDVSVIEGDSGTSIATFTVTLDADVNSAFTVGVETADGTATTGDNDYVANSEFLSFLGQQGETHSFSVSINGDTTVEPNELFYARLQSISLPGHDIVLGPQGIGTITNDDGATLSINDVSVEEGDSGTQDFVFTVTLDSAVAESFTIDFATGDGSATVADNDYVANSGSLTFSGTEGETQTISVVVNGDTAFEPDEFFLINLSNLSLTSDDLVIGDGLAVGNITNDDLAQISVAVSPESVAEDGTDVLTYTFTRANTTSNSPGQTVLFDVSGTAMPGIDFDISGTGTNVEFAPGATTATITIDPTADGDFEADETVTLTVLDSIDVAPITPSSATGTIRNDDVALVNVVVSPEAVDEDDDELLTFTFTRLNVGSDVPGQTVLFDVSGTAMPGIDFDISGTGTSVDFAPGATTATITIDPIADGDFEADETVTLTVLDSTGAAPITPSSATGTIRDDDVALVNVVVSPEAVDEDDDELLTFTFTRLNVGSDVPGQTVLFDVSGTAMPGIDFDISGTGTSVDFAPGATTATITIDPIADGDFEADETVTLTVLDSTGAAPITPDNATGTIRNDDKSLIEIDVVPGAVNEDGTDSLIYTFTRSNVGSDAPGQTVAFEFLGTATPLIDYLFAGTGTDVDFALGSSTATFTVSPISDDIVEPDESVIVSLIDGPDYDFTVPERATGVITNDDSSTVNVQVSPNSVLEDSPTGQLTYTFTRDNVSAQTPALSVPFVTSGTAGSDDYVASSTGSVTFNPGEATAVVTVDPIADLNVEPDETVVLTLQTGAYVIGSSDSATGTILNDDRATITVDVSPSEIAEDDPGVLTYTFTRSDSTGPLDVSYSRSGTASPGLDFSSTGTGTVSFLPGEFTAIVEIVPVDDATVESPETVTLAIDSDEGYAVGAENSATGTIIDNDISEVSLALGPNSIAEDAPGTMNFSFVRSNVDSTSPALTVQFTTTGAATPGDDYIASHSGTVSFEVGSSIAVVTVDPVSDVDVEPDEDVTLTITPNAAYTVGAPDTLTGTIRNDDFLPVIDVSVGVASEFEDNAVTERVFEFTRTGNLSLPLTVDIAISGSATPGIDYTAFPSTASITFPANVATQTLSTDVIPDVVVEPDETIVVSILTDSSYSVDTTAGSAETVIVNDDQSTVSLLSVSSDVLEDSNDLITFTFGRDNTSAETPALDVLFSTTGTAVEGTDYSASDTGLFTFAAGSSTATVTIDPTLDVVVELDETVTLTIDPDAAYLVGTQDSGTGQILNDDSATLSIDDVSVDEGDSGIKEIIFDVTLSNPVDHEVSYDFETVDGSASSASGDYNARNGTQVINGTQQITVEVNGDEIVELDETFLMQLSGLSAGGRDVTFARDEAVGTILDDDSASLSISDASVFEGNAGTVNLQFVVTLNGSLDAPLTVDFVTQDDTATVSDNDYNAVSGTLSFDGFDGEIETISVPVIGDTNIEPDEQLLALLANVQAGNRSVILADDTGTGTILNDDLDTPSVAVERVIYFNQDADSEANILADGSGQRSIIRRIQVTFAGPVDIEVGAVLDDSFVVEKEDGDRAELEVISSELIDGKQIVVLGFLASDLTERTSQTPAGVRDMLIDGIYSLKVDGAQLNIDANGDDPGVVAVDEFHRRYGDFDGDTDTDARDKRQFNGFFSRGFLQEIFDFDGDNTTRDKEDQREFLDRFLGRK